MSTIDNLSKRLERIAGTLPEIEPDDTLIAHLSDTEKEALIRERATRTLPKIAKLVIAWHKGDISEEEYHAAIAEVQTHTPEEEAVSRWWNKSHQHEDIEGMREILCSKLERMHRAQTEKQATNK